MPREDYVPAPLSPEEAVALESIYASRAIAGVTLPPRPVLPSFRVQRLCLALFLLGLVTLFFGQKRLAYAQATRGWIETPATITSAKLRADATRYHLDLEYRYRAGLRERTGRRIALRPELTREAAYKYAQRFRPGTQVPAWFNPVSPDSVVLERPQVAAPWAPVLVGYGLPAAGIAPFGYYLFKLYRHHRARRRAI